MWTAYGAIVKYFLFVESLRTASRAVLLLRTAIFAAADLAFEKPHFSQRLLLLHFVGAGLIRARHFGAAVWHLERQSFLSQSCFVLCAVPLWKRHSAKT